MHAWPTNRPFEPQTLVCKTDGDKKSISEDHAKKLYKKAPSGKDVKTKSGFPHIFNNREGIKWDNKACNSKKVKTLEFPIFEGNNPPMFEWKEKKPSKEPGACRVVYSETDSHYCGVMCHESQKSSKPEDRKFAKCT